MQRSRSLRFWILLGCLSFVDGAAAMTSYAFLYGYLGLAPALEPGVEAFGVPMAGFEFVVILVLVSWVNLWVIGRIYRYAAFNLLWSDRAAKASLVETIVGIVALHVGGLLTVLAAWAVADGRTIFDKGHGYLIALFMATIVIVIVTAPAIASGESKPPTGPVETSDGTSI